MVYLRDWPGLWWILDNLLSFHALAGCDSTSSFSGHGKKKCWKIFQNQPLDVNGIGRDGDQAPTVCLSPVWHTWTANRRTCQERATGLWRCCRQPEMPWNSMLHEQTTRLRSGCRQTRNMSHLPPKPVPGRRNQEAYKLCDEDCPPSPLPMPVWSL